MKYKQVSVWWVYNAFVIGIIFGIVISYLDLIINIIFK